MGKISNRRQRQAQPAKKDQFTVGKKKREKSKSGNERQAATPHHGESGETVKAGKHSAASKHAKGKLPTQNHSGESTLSQEAKSSPKKATQNAASRTDVVLQAENPEKVNEKCSQAEGKKANGARDESNEEKEQAAAIAEAGVTNDPTHGKMEKHTKSRSHRSHKTKRRSGHERTCDDDTNQNRAEEKHDSTLKRKKKSSTVEGGEVED